MIRLTVQLPGAPPRTYSFDDTETVTIGRSPSNRLPIPDGRVSGLHGELVPRPPGVVYRDLRSTNGSLRLRGGERTVVDGAAGTGIGLQDGDVLLLGDADDPVVVQVSVLAGPAAPHAVPEGTVVARRAVERGAELSRVLLGVGPADAGTVALVSLLRQIGEETEIERVFGPVAGFLLDRLRAARRVLLVLTDRETTVLGVDLQSRTPQVLEGDPPPYPRGLVRQVLESGEAVRAAGEAALDPEVSLVRFGAEGALALPLVAGGDPVGALVITGGPPGFSDADLDVAVALAYQVGHAFGIARLVRRLRAVERRLREENTYLRQQVERDETFAEIVGGSPAIRAVFTEMRVVMDTDTTVLITGETGTGKELVARALHDKSRRASRLFAAVNCAALSENLLESELFGHVRGAFTGATENKKGLFQVADGGTLFLDEIGELSLKLQAKLLRVLQEGEVMPVGSTRPAKVDVRVLCATHRDLRAGVREGRFREDLYYRINVFPIRVPALRERGEDVPVLAQFFLDRYAERFRKSVPGFTAEALRFLRAYPFPGNIRELENVVQRGLLLAPEGQPIDARHLPEEVRSGDGAAPPGAPGGVSMDVPPSGTLKDTMELLEREVLRRSLEAHGWNRSQTARTLQISRQALQVKLSRYDLAPE